MSGIHHNKRAQMRKPHSDKASSYKKLLLMLVSISALLVVMIGSTLAYVFTSSDTKSNVFTPGQMSCVIEEDFTDGINKKSVRVHNTGDAPAYIRVKLLPYWYDKTENVIVAKKAWIPEFTLGTDWKLGADGYYYYLHAVEPEGYTASLIATGSAITLKQDDVSLARQVLEIIASCVQAQPETVVTSVWSGTNGSVTGVSSGQLTITQP